MRIQLEVGGAEFGDKRLSRRLTSLTEKLAMSPDQSFPAAAGDSAALEATYRFLNNESVTPERILEPHFEASARRAKSASRVIVAHDTTEFLFEGRTDMGRLGQGRVGFLGHFALGMAIDGAKIPIGVMGMRTIFRYGRAKSRKNRNRRRFSTTSEELRWWELVSEIEDRVARDGSSKMIHVMDREADAYTLLARLIARQCRFVIRMAHDRRVEVGEAPREKVSAALARANFMIEREVPISKRLPNPRIKNSRAHGGPRDARLAKLQFSVLQARIPRPGWAAKDTQSHLDVNIVRVLEVDAPNECVPIEWRLVTTEPVANLEQIAEVVDAYRARWTIEEYFKALKTGCAFEKRQLENKRAILNALAVFLPIAWQLLYLRGAAREESDRPAAALLSALQLRILQRHPALKLKQRPTMREASKAIAKLGGHLPSNGEPGWQVLGRGYEKLLMLAEGALLSQNCDQS